MSTIVYQELQSSSNESTSFIESRTLSLKLINSSKQCQTLSPSNSFQQISSKSQYELRNSGSWGTIEALSSKKDEKVEKEEAVYVHPLVKRSSFMLTDRSLEMCTESLGNETGTCDLESGVFLPSTTTMAERKPRRKLEHTTMKKEVLVVDHGKFPPPLTTISGSNHIHVKPYRENGRLVMEAVSAPPPVQSYMQAERSDGRLTLTMVRESPSDDIYVDDDEDDSFDNQSTEDCEEEQVISDVEEVRVGKEEVKECNNNKDDENLVREMNGKTKTVVEFGGLGKIQRLSRCKEGGHRNKRLINWEPFWVVT